MSKLNWPRPVAYIAHPVMGEDTVGFTKDKRAGRHTPLYAREDVEKLLEQHRKLLLVQNVRTVGEIVGGGRGGLGI